MSDYYVSPTGNDSNNGLSLGAAWLTLAHAASSISGGDTVNVADGTVTLTSSVIITTSGTDDTHRTVFQSINRWGAKLVNSITVTDSSSDATVQINADYIDFTGFDVSGSGRIGIYNSGSSTGSGSPLGSHNRIDFNFVHDLGLGLDSTHNVSGINGARYGSGVYNAIYNEVRGNILLNIGNAHNSGSHGIYFGTAHATIQNNIVSGVPGYGIRAFHFSHHMTISNNLVFNCGDNSLDPAGGAGGGIYISAGGTGWTAGVDEPHDFSTITNNIVKDCVGWGGILETANNFGAPNTQVVANNTFSNNCAFNNSGVHGNVELDSGAAFSNPLLNPPASTTHGNDTFTRANQSGFGTATDGQSWANAGDTANVQLSILSNQGKVTNSTAANYITLGSTNYTGDQEVLVRISTSSAATNNAQGALLRYTDTTHWYAAYFHGTTLHIDSAVAALSSAAFTFVASTEYWLRFNLTGTTLSAKVWAASGGEPASWMVSATDSSLSTGKPGIYANPNASGTTALYDSFTFVTLVTDMTFPHFVNYQLDGTGDYHLSASSPCINAGTSTGAPLIDLDGLLRPRGAGFDIGPYEYPSVITYADYRDTIEPNLVAALAGKSLLSAVRVIGPDTTMASDSWLTSASTDLSSTLSGYVRHAFPAGATDISSGSIEVAAKSLVASIVANDPTGKPIIQGEMAVAAQGPGQSVALYQYGVEMADFAVQLARAGMAALIAYDLDDDMHGTQWGMWEATGGTPLLVTTSVTRIFGGTLVGGAQVSVPTSTAIRPWFFLWSMLTRMLVPGSTLYAPAQPSSNDLRVLAAQSPQGAWTFVLVNRKATAQNIQVNVPFAPVVATAMQAYSYSAVAPLLVDTGGFPLASGALQAVLSRGFTVTLAANAVLILSQQTATTTNLYDVKRPPLQKRR